MEFGRVNAKSRDCGMELELTKLTGLFQPWLSCFLFREPGGSHPFSAPCQSILRSPIMTECCCPCSVSWHWWLNSSRIRERERGGRESFSYSVLLLLLLLLAPFSTRASVPPHPPTINTTTLVQIFQLQLNSLTCDIIQQCWGTVKVDQSAGDITTTKFNKSISVAFLTMQHDLFQNWNWILSAQRVNDAGCALWLVKFIPFCVAGRLSIPPTIDERVLCLTIRQAIQVLQLRFPLVNTDFSCNVCLEKRFNDISLKHTRNTCYKKKHLAKRAKIHFLRDNRTAHFSECLCNTTAKTRQNMLWLKRVLLCWNAAHVWVVHGSSRRGRKEEKVPILEMLHLHPASQS